MSVSPIFVQVVFMAIHYHAQKVRRVTCNIESGKTRVPAFDSQHLTSHWELVMLTSCAPTIKLLCIPVIWWRFKSFILRTTLTFGTKLGHFVSVVSVVSLWFLNLLLLCVFLSSTQSPQYFAVLKVLTADISDYTFKTFILFVIVCFAVFLLVCNYHRAADMQLMICVQNFKSSASTMTTTLVFFFNWCSASCGGDAAFFLTCKLLTKKPFGTDAELTLIGRIVWL